MKKLQKLLITTMLTAGFTGLFMVAFNTSSVSAQANPDGSLCSGSNLSLKPASDTYNPCADKNGDGKVDGADTAGESSQSKLDGVIKTVVNILSVIVGIIAVIAVILGGAKYITSGGDSGKVASAKNTVIYALVGLIIVALSQVIVRFVLSKV